MHCSTVLCVTGAEPAWVALPVACWLGCVKMYAAQILEAGRANNLGRDCHQSSSP